MPEHTSESLSRNHHYVPRYYLKGFCRQDSTFDVYDKQYKQYKQFRKQPQYPGKVFFEKDRNIVCFRGVRTDQIEKLYAGVESGLGNLFNSIRAGMSSEELLQPKGIRLLKIHMAIQFWRLPRMDGFADGFLLSLTPADLERICSIATPFMPCQKVYDLIQSDKGFRHYFRSFWLPLATFDLSERIPEEMTWSLLDVEDATRWSNLLCSDAPFIFLQPESLLSFSGSFVFPLSGSRLLVSKPRSNSSSSYDPSLSVRLSILLYLQASRFVAAVNRSYIEKVIELSHHYVGADGTQRLEAEVLGFLNKSIVYESKC